MQFQKNSTQNIICFAEALDEVINLGLREDIGDGDHTTLSTIASHHIGQAQLNVKQNGVLCGIEVAKRIFEIFDNSIQFKQIMHDGAIIKQGDVAFTVQGSSASIVQCERLVLNFMQRLSGIASQTAEYVKAVSGTKTQILDTRKTTPGLRLLEKYAVKTGGGVNHRIGLYDMILIKDNHIDFSGGITQALKNAQDYIKAHNKNLLIEIEARTLEDIELILSIGGVTRILIDNFTVTEMKQAVDLIGGKCSTEASGGITLETIRDYALTGVDYISVGALTHQIKSLDLSLKAI